MLVGTLGASLLGNVLVGKEVRPASEGKAVVSRGQGVIGVSERAIATSWRRLGTTREGHDF